MKKLLILRVIFFPRFDTFDVQRLINAIKKNPKNIQFIKDLINETQIDSNGNFVPRFGALGIEELTNLVKDNSKNIQFIKDLINKKTIDSKGNIVPRFDTFDVRGTLFLDLILLMYKD